MGLKEARRVCLVTLIVILAISAFALDRDMARFAATKETQARELTEGQATKVPSLVWSFFDAVRVDDWETATNLFSRLEQLKGTRPNPEPDSPAAALRTSVWPPLAETSGAYESFQNWDNKWLHRFAHEIIDSIPKESIYFGGTDPGRFIISAFSESHRDGEPFFTITQNQLADVGYLDYLRSMYGTKIKVPTTEDLRKVFQEYVADARERLKAGRLKPGEDVRIVEEQVQVSGHVAVMELNARMAKIVVAKNSGREFYVEESYPLDWMYPYLSPHGLIFKLNPSPLVGLRKEMVERNDEFWRHLTGEIVGNWLTDKTSVEEICDFTDRVYGQENLQGFKGDLGFIRSTATQKCFAKLRASIAGLYVWRAQRTKDEEERNRLRKSADLAYRQAIVMCPYSPEAVFRYCQLLKETKRTDDALLIAKTAARLEPDNASVANLVRSLRRLE